MHVQMLLYLNSVLSISAAALYDPINRIYVDNVTTMVHMHAGRPLQDSPVSGTQLQHR